MTDMKQKILRDPEAWSCLGEEQQRALYAILPLGGDAARNAEIDPRVNPMIHGPYTEHLKGFFAHVEEHLNEGAGARAWRTEAHAASKSRAAGKYAASESMVDDA